MSEEQLREGDAQEEGGNTGLEFWREGTGNYQQKDGSYMHSFAKKRLYKKEEWGRKLQN